MAGWLSVFTLFTISEILRTSVKINIGQICLWSMADCFCVPTWRCDEWWLASDWSLGTILASDWLSWDGMTRATQTRPGTDWGALPSSPAAPGPERRWRGCVMSGVWWDTEIDGWWSLMTDKHWTQQCQNVGNLINSKSEKRYIIGAQVMKVKIRCQEKTNISPSPDHKLSAILPFFPLAALLIEHWTLTTLLPYCMTHHHTTQTALRSLNQ